MQQGLHCSSVQGLDELEGQKVFHRRVGLTILEGNRSSVAWLRASPRLSSKRPLFLRCPSPWLQG